MFLKKYKPNTSAQRDTILVSKSSLWKGRPLKVLSKGLNKSAGRNNFGRITSWHKGGGHKNLYRIIDFKRDKCDIEARVKRLEYDPNRTSFIALITYEDGVSSYILAPNDLKINDKVISGDRAEIAVGNSLKLANIPVGTNIHNIELRPGKGGQLVRSAGTFASIVGKSGGYAQIKFGSGEVRLVLLKCRATIGVVSNADKKNIKLGKAGRNRWLGVRPTVRGVAMNPVDHPHGGGEGKTSGGRHPVTPWGKSTKGKKTRKKKSTSKFILSKRK
ncbi:MAG: 50S ribosomal protein L2 [Rickettsia sp.]|nr:50S ribosomal protein L2 [Rickettsia sp.]